MAQDAGDGAYTIVAGHGVKLAAEAEGWATLRCDVLPQSWPAAQVKAYLVADNQLARLAEDDEAQLASLIEEARAFDAGLLEAMGYDEDELEDLLTRVGRETPGGEDPGPEVARADELREKWGTALGQIWSTGRAPADLRRCDATGDIRAADGGRTGAGGGYQPALWRGQGIRGEGRRGVVRDGAAGDRACFARTEVAVWQMGDLYATGSQFIEPTFAHALGMFAEQGFRPIWIRIWEKQGINFGIGPYHLVSNKPAQQYEYIGALAPTVDDVVETDQTDFAWIVAAAHARYRYVRRLSQAERRDWGYAGVWKINTVPANDDHPAMFPLELPERCIKMHSDPGGLVLEPFSGSGTTLIACERLGRSLPGDRAGPGLCGRGAGAVGGDDGADAGAG